MLALGTDQASRLCTCPAGMKLLAKINDPIVVLSIAGPRYTGKAYILSRMLGSPDAFTLERDVRHLHDAQTIWIATHALKYENHVVVLLLADTDTDVKKNQSVLALTLLLSSQFIYNVFDIPRGGDLIKIRYVPIFFITSIINFTICLGVLYHLLNLLHTLNNVLLIVCGFLGTFCENSQTTVVAMN